MNTTQLSPNPFLKNALIFTSFLVFSLFLQLAIADNHAGEKPSMDDTQAVWLDVRNADEYAADHIKGDLNIPIDQLLDDIGYYISDKNTPIKVYCQLGKRAKRATDRLLENGYTDVECIGTIDQARERRGMMTEPNE
ncbi:rhodanese-like domain-containing protein [Thiomicrorhabdus sediminis]|uniref:Rhodanese-like domain-containing protein n=1 Tax=Thiomicrorhabdus sediminis TaxID=2580412 RepID=A0A4V1HHS9_9GAMM|nr:rhodanese-like domain-containing protein [Thiomicrorhabdus sediminis]QCU90083.1 rhodanese-like domain-containing protein [Thiomicrorhabdus sediminis]